MSQTANPLVAGPVDTTTPLSGALFFESCEQVVQAIRDQSWVQGALSGVSLALDTVAMALDPLGSLIGAGLGWLIDHLEPLKGWFNDFTGDAGMVAGFAATWDNVASRLQEMQEDLNHYLQDLQNMAGRAIDSYLNLQQDVLKHLGTATSWASAISTGLQVASTIVQLVHDLVRDVLSQLVGSIISWVATLALTAGLATPWVISQVSTRVASLSTRVGTNVTSAISSLRNLQGLLKQLTSALHNSDNLFAAALRGGTPSGPRPGGARQPSAPAADAPRRPSTAPDEVMDRIRSGEMTPDEIRALPESTRDQLRGLDRGDGRDIFGHFTGTDVVSANKEALGLSRVSDRLGVEVLPDRVGVRLESGGQLRYYDGLVHVQGNQYIGVEVKSGSASAQYARPSDLQRLFDVRVSSTNPATGTLNGQRIEIIDVILQKVP